MSKFCIYWKIMKCSIKKKKIIIFLLIWAWIFTIVSIYPLISGDSIRIWALVMTVLFVFVSIVNPFLLERFYNVWIKVGESIGGVVSKIIMFVLYFAVFTPVSMFLKLLGKDLLDKKLDKDVASYWIERETQPQSMTKQF